MVNRKPVGLRSCRTRFGPYSRIPKVRWTSRTVLSGTSTASRRPSAPNYQAGDRKVSVSVWQLKDTTGALAALQWLQPGVIQHGNYVLRVEGQLNPDGTLRS